VALGVRIQIVTGFLKAVWALMDSSQNDNNDDDDDDDDVTEGNIFLICFPHTIVPVLSRHSGL
jgi:hypothetical protein